MPLTSDVWQNFVLRQDTREPSSFRIGANGGAAVLTGTIPSADLDTIMTDGLETTTPDNETGQLVRTLPVAHPRFPWLFLRNIDNATGISFTGKQAADPEGTLEVATLPYWAEYRKYEVQASFEPRPYLMARDESIPKTTFTYYDDDGDPVAAESWCEWWRYTTFDAAPASETLVAEIGQMRWAAPGIGQATATAPKDGSGVEQGLTRILLPSITWKVTWYGAPYSYVLSDYCVFLDVIGRINQNEWAGFAPGAALLQAVNVQRIYPPPFPDFTTYNGYDLIGQDKLCDIEFTILEVNRTPDIAVTPVNRSHIAANHNCMPYRAGHRYYYVESFRPENAPAGTGEPPYLSYPFEFLTNNPDWLFG